MQRFLGINLLIFLLLLTILIGRLPRPVSAKTQSTTDYDPLICQMREIVSAFRQTRQAANTGSVRRLTAVTADNSMITTDSWSMTASVTGMISYFAGQTNSLGQTLPANDRRFLLGECLHLVMDFSEDPGLITIRFGGRVWQYNGFAGVRHYETSLIVPEQPQTLSWANERISEPLTLTITAQSRLNPSEQAEFFLSGIDITGHIHQIVRVQPVRWS